MKTKGRFDRFYSLLALMPDPDKEALKEDLVWQFSNMVTISLKEFYDTNPDGYKRMLAKMQGEVDRHNPKRFALLETKRLRSAILHRLQKFGVDTTCWGSVNAFLQSPRIAGKRLYNMSNAEMEALIPKLESILRKDAEKKDAERHLAKCN